MLDYCWGNRRAEVQGHQEGHGRFKVRKPRVVGEGLGYGRNRRDEIWLRDVNSGVFRRGG